MSDSPPPRATPKLEHAIVASRARYRLIIDGIKKDTGFGKKNKPDSITHEEDLVGLAATALRKKRTRFWRLRLLVPKNRAENSAALPVVRVPPHGGYWCAVTLCGGRDLLVSNRRDSTSLGEPCGFSLADRWKKLPGDSGSQDRRDFGLTQSCFVDFLNGVPARPLAGLCNFYVAPAVQPLCAWGSNALPGEGHYLPSFCIRWMLVVVAGLAREGVRRRALRGGPAVGVRAEHRRSPGLDGHHGGWPSIPGVHPSPLLLRTLRRLSCNRTTMSSRFQR